MPAANETMVSSACCMRVSKNDPERQIRCAVGHNTYTGRRASEQGFSGSFGDEMGHNLTLFPIRTPTSIRSMATGRGLFVLWWRRGNFDSDVARDAVFAAGTDIENPHGGLEVGCGL